MAYAIRRSPTSETLVEMPAATLRRAAAGRHDQARYDITFHRVAAAVAHRWVLAGGMHETTLWVDAGKIRKS